MGLPMVTLRGQLTFQAIQTTACPACQAKPGETCRDDVYLRWKFLVDGHLIHSQRVTAWREFICGKNEVEK